MRDMTVGSPHSHLWRYALPLLLGNWLQLAYNAVDSIIAGRFVGKEALAAEGIAGPVMNLVILAITGLCIGAGVLMSEAFGAKDFNRLRQTLATTLLFGAIVCSIVAVVCMILTSWILHFMAVPEEIFDITVVYLRITFLGAPFTFFYNALAAGLKSVGDSKTPLKFLAFSAVLNAVLDLIFLGLLDFGIVCSAVTTVVAEVTSAALACSYMIRKVPELCPERKQWNINHVLLGKVLQYGGPTALQQAVQPIGKVLIQGQVNALGVNVIAAYNAVTRVDDFACIPEQGISSSISTYIAQNRGAEKKERIRSGFRAGIRLEICYWILIGTVAVLFRTPIVSMFVTGEGAKEVIALGSRYLGYMAIFYLWPAMTNGVQGFFRGMGKMYTTILGTTLQTTLRTICTFILAPRFGIVGIAFSCVIGWSAMLLFEVPYYVITCRKQELKL
ncbi:MAG: MATE family efflux transporter [Lachnospiraceae bacterium]|nr:MATE family efflux transporter [Lachnospiraceae bacterium]